MKKKAPTQSEIELRKAVRAYNQRIDRALKSGRITPELAPQKVSLREIKKDVSNLDARKRAPEMRRITKELREMSRRDALKIVKTEGGVEITKYEYNRAKQLYEKAKKKQIAEAKKKALADKNAPKLGGVPVKPPRGWGEGAAPPNPEKATTPAEFAEKVEAAARFIGGGNEWTLYRIELIMNFNKHYSGENLRTLKQSLEHISDANLEKAYHAGEDFADQSFHYEENPDVSRILDTMANYHDR